jgi:hypothetical protein
VRGRDYKWLADPNMGAVNVRLPVRLLPTKELVSIGLTPETYPCVIQNSVVALQIVTERYSNMLRPEAYEI